MLLVLLKILYQVNFLTLIFVDIISTTLSDENWNEMCTKHISTCLLFDTSINRRRCRNAVVALIEGNREIWWCNIRRRFRREYSWLTKIMHHRGCLHRGQADLKYLPKCFNQNINYYQWRQSFSKQVGRHLFTLSPPPFFSKLNFCRAKKK